MSNDILEPYRPIDHQFRQTLKEDIEVLKEISFIWIETTHSMLEPIRLYFDLWDSYKATPACIVPRGYRELTHLLMYWCDSSKDFNIDAAPLGDFLDSIKDMRDEDLHVGDSDAFYDCCKAESRARRVVDRMLYAAFAVAGHEPPKPPRRGRPPGSTSRNAKGPKIKEALRNSEYPESICKKFDVTKQYVRKIARSLKSETVPKKRPRKR